MKIIYELDSNDDTSDVQMFKYAADFYLALTHIDDLMRAYRKGYQEELNDAEVIHDKICEFLAESNIHEIN